MKKFISILLVLAMLLSFVGCAKEEDVIGAWEREVTYLESYGCDCTMYLLFAPNGTCIKMLLATHTDDLLNLELGDWEIDGMEVVVDWQDSMGNTAYKIRGKHLKNGDYKYTQTDRADEMFQLLYSVL